MNLSLNQPHGHPVHNTIICLMTFCVWELFVCVWRRRSVPKELPVSCQDDTETFVPRLCARLPPAPWRCATAWRGSSPQHILQTLHLLHWGIQPDWQERANAAARSDRRTERQGPAVIYCDKVELVALPSVWRQKWTNLCFACDVGFFSSDGFQTSMNVEWHKYLADFLVLSSRADIRYMHRSVQILGQQCGGCTMSD